MDAISAAGGIPHEFRCYGLVSTGEILSLEGADAILFTSAMSFTRAVWTKHPDLLLIAIGDITAAAMTRAGINPDVVGDGSLEGSLRALNEYIAGQEDVQNDTECRQD
jgi:uroporphyrinogen-III synthase